MESEINGADWGRLSPSQSYTLKRTLLDGHSLAATHRVTGVSILTVLSYRDKYLDEPFQLELFPELLDR